MSFQTATRTDTGRKRDVNEDAVSVVSDVEWTLLAVADGMGGHAAGDVASEVALDVFADAIESRIAGSSDESVTDILESSVVAANERLRELIADDSSLADMGTTLVAALVENQTARIVNVGDSRAYHLTDDTIRQVSVDQSLVQNLLDQGHISPEEAKSHPQRNVVSQALGTDPTVEPDQYEIDVDGTLLLCSDGLSEEVPDASIQAIVRDAPNLDSAADSLVERANQNGGSDNVSVALGAFE